MLSVERGKLVRRCYWQWRYPPERDVEAPPYARVCEELRQRLVASVRLQLRADVPVGAYLSGGLDSSAVAALIRRYTGAPLMVLSGLVREAGYKQTIWPSWAYYQRCCLIHNQRYDSVASRWTQ